MEPLKEIIDKAIANYGFRQVVMWSPDDIIDQWGLSDQETRVLQDILIEELEALPVPVEPENVAAEIERLEGLIEGGVGRNK
jgi:hypothetical protein